MADTNPGDKGGRQLRHYWTSGPGLARWAASAHPWTTLRNALISEGVSPTLADNLASSYFKDVFGYWPGERKGKNPVGRG